MPNVHLHAKRVWLRAEGTYRTRDGSRHGLRLEYMAIGEPPSEPRLDSWPWHQVGAPHGMQFRWRGDGRFFLGAEDHPLDLVEEESADGLAATQGALDRMAARAATPENERIAAVAAESATLGSDAETLGSRIVEPSPRVPCPLCQQKNHARVHEQKADGHFAPGPLLRCVNCKEVFRDPAAPLALSAKRLAEIDANAQAAPAGPWQLTRCDDGRLMVHTVGDTICHSDPNHREPDDERTMRHLAGLDRNTVLAMTAEIRSLARRLGEAEHKLRGLQMRASLEAEADGSDDYQAAVHAMLGHSVAEEGFDHG